MTRTTAILSSRMNRTLIMVKVKNIKSKLLLSLRSLTSKIKIIGKLIKKNSTLMPSSRKLENGKIILEAKNYSYSNNLNKKTINSNNLLHLPKHPPKIRCLSSLQLLRVNLCKKNKISPKSNNYLNAKDNNFIRKNQNFRGRF